MSRLRMVAVAGVLAAQVTGAMAADMPGSYEPEPVKQWLPSLDLNTGWYLRGDVGYNWGRIDGAESTAPFTDPTENTLGNGVVAGAGAGIKTKWLRTDFTVDYTFPLDYKGTAVSTDDVTAKISAVSALFNAYLDLGTWYGFTPYIGAGAGAAYMSVSDYASTATPPFTGNADNTQWNFAWAVMAGAGYAVAPNLIVDVGYRYIDFGDVSTASDASGDVTFKDIAAHEVRVGLRWTFDDIKGSTW